MASVVGDGYLKRRQGARAPSSPTRGTAARPAAAAPRCTAAGAPPCNLKFSLSITHTAKLTAGKLHVQL